MVDSLLSKGQMFSRVTSLYSKFVRFSMSVLTGLMVVEEGNICNRGCGDICVWNAANRQCNYTCQ